MVGLRSAMRSGRLRQGPAGAVRRGARYNPGMISVQAISMMAGSVRAGQSPETPDGDGTTVLERDTVALSPPPLYQVVMLNDDFTPQDFVVMVLQQHFQRDLESATRIMLTIHHEGRGVCGQYTRDIAATKVEIVTALARKAGHPLQCIMEAA